MKIEFKILSTKRDTEGRIIIVECKLDDNIYVLVNVYTPTKDKHNDQLSFLSKLKEMLENCNCKPLIIGRDVNTYLNVIEDKKGGTPEETICLQ